jgi:hypothetical protein
VRVLPCVAVWIREDPCVSAVKVSAAGRVTAAPPRHRSGAGWTRTSRAASRSATSTTVTAPLAVESHVLRRPVGAMPRNSPTWVASVRERLRCHTDRKSDCRTPLSTATAEASAATVIDESSEPHAQAVRTGTGSGRTHLSRTPGSSLGRLRTRAPRRPRPGTRRWPRRSASRSRTSSIVRRTISHGVATAPGPLKRGSSSVTGFGAGTAFSLHRYGIDVVIAPKSSETLLVPPQAGGPRQGPPGAPTAFEATQHVWQVPTRPAPLRLAQMGYTLGVGFRGRGLQIGRPAQSARLKRGSVPRRLASSNGTAAAATRTRLCRPPLRAARASAGWDHVGSQVQAGWTGARLRQSHGGEHPPRCPLDW